METSGQLSEEAFWKPFLENRKREKRYLDIHEVGTSSSGIKENENSEGDKDKDVYPEKRGSEKECQASFFFQRREKSRQVFPIFDEIYQTVHRAEKEKQAV